MIKKEAEKILKYKDLIIEFLCMWNVKAEVILVIIRHLEPSIYHSDNIKATYWESTKSRNYKNSHIGTAHVLHKELM